MPNVVGKVLQAHPRDVEKLSVIISSNVHRRGKPSMQDGNGFSPTDEQFASAIISGAVIAPPVVTLSTPPVQNQLNEGACVAFSAGYCRDIEEYYRTSASSYSTSTNIYSPEYLYNQTKLNCAAGTAPETVLDLMISKGVCLWVTMPQVDMDCDTQPNAIQNAEAALHKIPSYALIWKGDRAAIKNRILTNHPVMVTLVADNNFINATGEFIWSDTTQSPTGAIRHTATIIGYDDTRNAYKVLNSWGNTWGLGGFCWIDYNFFEKSTTGAKIVYYVHTITGFQSVGVPPTANAGQDTTIPSGGTATLNGSASFDSDGYIASYLWEKVSGPSTPTIANSTSPVASITPILAGTYVYSLTVVDNNSNTASDTVVVTVTPNVTESAVLTLTTSKSGGRTTDKLTWTITLAQNPQSAEIQLGKTSTSFSTLKTIVPYTAQGSFTHVTKSRIRYYRIKVIKSDGQILYSNTIIAS